MIQSLGLSDKEIGIIITAVFHVHCSRKIAQVIMDKENMKNTKIKLSEMLKKELIGPGLHLRPVRADCTRPPLQWTLNSVLSACGNDNGRIRPPLGRGILKITSRLRATDTNQP